MRRTAVIFALFWELRPFARKLNVPFYKTLKPQVILDEKGIAMIRAGTGKEKAILATERIIKDFHPETVISAGFGGALVEDLRVGDIVVSNLSDRKLFCSAKPLFTCEEKTAAYRDHKAVIVDMESEGVASVAGKYGVAFLAVKAVTDSLKDDLPRTLRDFMSLSKLAGLKRAADHASKNLAEFLFNYVNKGDADENSPGPIDR